MRRTGAGILALCAALALLPTTVPAQPGAESIARAIANPDRSDRDRQRDGRSHPEVVLALLGIGPGDRVADIFGGAGYYSELLGRVVGPAGEVLLHNNRAYINYVGGALAERFEGRDLPAVRRHEREVDDLDLGEGVLDAVLIVMSYHDLYHTAEDWPAIDVDHFVGQIVAALKPGGRFLLVDHVAARGTGSSAAQELHRIEPAFARADVERFGLRFAGGSDVLRNPDDDHTRSAFDPAVRGRTDRFVMVFEKP